MTITHSAEDPDGDWVHHSDLLAAALTAPAGAPPADANPATTSLVQRNIERALEVKREAVGSSLKALEAAQLPHWVIRS